MTEALLCKCGGRSAYSTATEEPFPSRGIDRAGSACRRHLEKHDGPYFTRLACCNLTWVSNNKRKSRRAGKKELNPKTGRPTTNSTGSSHPVPALSLISALPFSTANRTHNKQALSRLARQTRNLTQIGMLGAAPQQDMVDAWHDCLVATPTKPLAGPTPYACRQPSRLGHHHPNRQSLSRCIRAPATKRVLAPRLATHAGT